MGAAADCLEAVARPRLHSAAANQTREEEDSLGAETLSQVVRPLEACLAVHQPTPQQDLGEASAVVLEEVLAVGPPLVRVPWASMLDNLPAEEHSEVVGSAPRTTSLKTRRLPLAGTLVDSSVNQPAEGCSETHHKLGLLVSHSKVELLQLASETRPKACSAVLLEASVLRIRPKLLVHSELNHNNNSSNNKPTSFTKSSHKGLN